LTVYSAAIARSPFVLTKALLGTVVKLVGLLGLFVIDGFYVLLNLLTPKKKRGSVIGTGLPGEGGIWPQFIAPQEGDSRSPCPALNALANHGILPRDGRNLHKKEISIAIQNTFNTGWTFPYMVLEAISEQYGRTVFELDDLNAHNIIEHDASLIRHDTKFQPDQSKPSIDLIEKLLSLIRKNGDELTPAILSHVSSIRRIQSKQQNRHFYMSGGHKFFGSANCTVMRYLIGTDSKTLKVFLEEERIPDGWEPICRDRFGLSLINFHYRLFQVELGIKTNLPQATIDSY